MRVRVETVGGWWLGRWWVGWVGWGGNGWGGVGWGGGGWGGVVVEILILRQVKKLENLAVQKLFSNALVG